MPAWGVNTFISIYGKCFALTISFLSTYKSNGVQGKVYKYEINVLYNNGDRITAEFTTKEAVVEFLTRYR